MKSVPTICIIILSLIISFSACKKDEENIGDKVELFLIIDYETLDESQEIKTSGIELSDEPLVIYDEFISYNVNEYTFKISTTAINRVKNLNSSIYQAAFAVTVDNDIIYTGYFWPSYLSSNCNWVVIDPILLDVSDELKVQLGYPGTIEGITIPDKRNDSRIIDVFRKDNKLIE